MFDRDFDEDEFEDDDYYDDGDYEYDPYEDDDLDDDEYEVERAMAYYEDDDPDPELDRWSVWDSQNEEYRSVYDVSRLVRWKRFLEYDWQVRVAGPFYRFRRRMIGIFKPCSICGHIGWKRYWFDDECHWHLSWREMRHVSKQ